MTIDGFELYPARLDPHDQATLLAQVLAAVEAAPFYRPVTPGGRPMSVRMTNLGALGWTTDAAGYRYQATHPVTLAPWPPIPTLLIALWRGLGEMRADPDCCLVNHYDAEARMGLHRDHDEADFSFPVLSVSLGDSAVFRLGGTARRGPTGTVRLASGDVCRLAGPARLAYHGIDRVIAGSSRLLPEGGRINLTLRRAAPL